VADAKISALPAVATPAGTDLVAAVQGGTTKKLTVAQALLAGDSPATLSALGIGAAASANADLLCEGGAVMLKETTTPTDDAGYGKVYTKADNVLYFQDGAGVEHALGAVLFKSYTLTMLGNASSHYMAGFYDAAAAEEVLTIGGTVTRTYGTVGGMKAAHAFVVAKEAGGADLVLTVSGVSITDAGVRNDSDSEVIVADTDTASADAYYETTKKWLGQITFTLTGTAGAFTFNYGFCKYEDFGNRAFTLTDFECVLHGATTSETGFDIQLLKHSTAGWTFHASAFVPGSTALVSSLTDYSSTNDNFAGNQDVAYKRAGLTEAVDGSASEGLVVRVVTANNNSVQYGDIHIGVRL